MQRLILTPEQARELQRGNTDWHELAEQLLAIQLPDTPDNLPDPERTNVALQMMELGCSDEQIADQLRLKVRGSTLKGLRKLHNGKR